MKNVPFKGKTSTAFGYKLTELFLKDGKPAPKTVSIEGTQPAYETFPELVAAKAELSNDEQVSARNAKVLAKLKAAAFKAKFDELGIVEPTMETSVLLQLTTVYDVYRVAGRSHEEARELASAGVGKPWPPARVEEEESAE